MRDTDESLLKSFALNRDEAAFRELADRYLGLIFHTALRRTGNRSLAEEISQNILCALARKVASLAKNPDLLPAWLHRATLYESSKAMRSESSHQRRKQLQHPDEISPTEHTESPWADALPHLDLALDKLPEADRGVLMLHYFEKRSFPLIARSLGKNPAAIQKQAQRALEKLARILRSRGVALSITAVAVGLTSEFAKAAPAAFLQSATTAVLSGSASYSTTGLTLMMASKSKALIPLALLLCVTPLALQQIAISRIQGRNAELRDIRHLVDRGESTSRISMAERKSSVSTNTDILVLFDEQKQVNRQGKLFKDEFEQKLAGLETKTLVRLIHEGAAMNANRERKSDLLGSLVAALAKQDAALAVITSVEVRTADPSMARAFVSVYDLPKYFTMWAEKDIGAAKDWLESLDNMEDESAGMFTGNGTLAKEFRGRMLAAMIAANSPDLRNFLLTRPENERSLMVKESISALGRSGREGVAGVLPLIREFVPEEERKAMLSEIASNLDEGFLSTRPDESPYAAAVDFFEKAQMAPAEKWAVASAKVEGILGTKRQPFDPATEARVLAESETFLRKVVPDQADLILETAQAEVHQQELRDAAKKIKELNADLKASDDAIVRLLVGYKMQSQLSEALKIAERIKDPDKRARTLEILNKQR